MTTTAGLSSGSTENLSERGLFIRTERAFRLGEPVSLILSFPSLLEPLEVEGRVRWLRDERPDEPAGVGVELEPGSQEKIAALVRAAAEPRDPTHRFRILLVEDNPHVVEMYRFALKKLAKTVALELEDARDGHEALKAMARARPDLVIADLRMPVLDGVELLRRIRGQPELARLPVVVITAADLEARIAAEDAGADAVLRKPVRSADVLETVRGLLSLRG